MTPEQLIDQFNLQPHPEGGFFNQTYISKEKIEKAHLPERFPGDRPFSTAIYFLLVENNFSAFHRIKSDEIWHFYTGGGLYVHVIGPEGKYELIKLGAQLKAGEVFQAVVPAGCWFASECAPGTAFSLVGCTVAPGFDFADFELAGKEELSVLYPEHKTLISRLTRQ
mgnify:CR=1 FL=1